MTIPKIGYYVTACLVQITITEDYPEGLNEPRQGVFIKDNEDGTIVVQGELERYLCFGPEGVIVVRD